MSAARKSAQNARAAPPAWVWVATALSVLTVINLGIAADDPLVELSPTTYGRSQGGYGALHDLLAELDSRPRSERSRAAYGELPRDRALWMLAPDLLEDSGEDPSSPLDEGGDALAAALQRWIERGGTALLFGTPTSDWSRYGLALAAPRLAKTQDERVALPSTLGPQRRVLELTNERHFDPNALGAFTRVLGAADAPFALQKRIGRGRLIAIADATPLQNQQLDRGDHALLALDLARAYGPPLFDERCHGLLPNASLSAALGMERSLLIAIGLGLCALLALWHLRSVPAATLARELGLDPGLQSFVDSLAVLYGRKAPRDAAAVYRAYLHGVRFRLRHQLYGARGGSDELLGQRLQRELGTEPELLACLQGRSIPRDERELQVAVRDLERSAAVLAERRTAREARQAREA
ncbi:MAG TPA: DUF4350 domain-containing protein [Polyangiales bacterium]|nr:DUF4350 domain-containing protein [Polyangiales bacterium]